MPAMSKWLGDVMESLFSGWIPLMFVTKIDYITAAVVRIRFAGDLNGMKFRPGYAVAIRVSETEYRNYTPCYVDVEHGLMDIVFHLHADAPGTSMLRKLEVGGELRISIPRGTNHYNPSARHQLLFGDETTFGLALSLHPIFQANNHCYHYCFELDEANIDAPALLGLDSFTVFRKSDTDFKNSPTFYSLPNLQSYHHSESEDWSQGNFILAGNAVSVQTVRKQLKQMGITGKISARGYWTKGKTGL
jgi:NAD(P)H-flavin reductase